AASGRRGSTFPHVWPVPVPGGGGIIECRQWLVPAWPWEVWQMVRTATLTFGDKTTELPVIEGSEGELALDITQLRAHTGLITLVPGFGNTGSCQSAITFIDGDNGILRYRGIPIE